MAESFKNKPKKLNVTTHIHFDYDSTKKAFQQELPFVLLKFKLHKVFLKKSDVEKIISDPFRQYNNKRYRTVSGTRYHIAKENGSDILCNITRAKRAPYKIISLQQIISVEEMFDVIAELHVCEPLLSLEEFVHKLSNCDIPRCLIELVWKACLCCKHTRLRFKTEAEISVIRIHVPNDGICSIFMYIDKNTNFILLRPLKTYQPEEVANELLSIFCDFGFPEHLDSNLKHYFQAVLKIFETLPLKFSVPQMYANCMDHKMTIMEKKVKHMIMDWMDKSKSSNWVIGAHIVQWMLNTTEVKDTYVRSKLIHGPIQSPYHALFGMLPNTDQVQFCYDKSMPENKNDFTFCSQCHQRVYKVYECHFCQSICHFMCCQRIVQEITKTSILINKCSSCVKTAEERILES